MSLKGQIVPNDYTIPFDVNQLKNRFNIYNKIINAYNDLNLRQRSQ